MTYDAYAKRDMSAYSKEDIDFFRKCDQMVLEYMNTLDTNKPNPTWIEESLIARILATRKIQALAIGIITRNRIHCALLSADPDVFANAVLLCSSKKRKRAD